MKNELAERILAKTMNWNPAVLKEEISILQMMSTLKYDEYQQFSNGKQFVESLALWLRRFPEKERQCMYTFIKENVVFISEKEMQQLISVVFEDIIRPKIIRKSKNLAFDKPFVDMEPRTIYRYFLRKTLFLGLSDGAHMDYFRRSNSFLNNEQVFMHYDFSAEKYNDMLKDLREGLSDENMEIDAEEQFNTFVLIDDFSGSGISYIRKEETQNGLVWKGKICTFLKSILEKCQLQERIDVHIVLYIATQSAIENIQKSVNEYIEEEGRNVQVSVEAVQQVNAAENFEEIESVLKRDFDDHNTDEYVTFMDRHYRKGNTEKPYCGFNGCKLALVLYHNTPNNSFPVLWHGWEKKGEDILAQKNEALFPRVTRHKES